MRHTNAALTKDPFNIHTLNVLENVQRSRGHLQEADAATRRALDIRPNHGYGHYNLGLILLMRGERERALLEMQQETIDDGKQQGEALAYFALGRKAEADAALAGLISAQAEGNALDIAEVYAFRGQSDVAMLWLERAFNQRDPYLYQIKGRLLLMNVESDPRYKALLKKMNLPE